MNKVLMEFLSKTLSLDEAGVTSLFNEDGSPKDDSLQKFLELDKARVARLQSGKLDEGYKKAQKEILLKHEADLKAKFGIESDKVGVELVEAIVEAKAPKGTELTEDAVKKSKWYLDYQEGEKKRIADAVKAEKEAHETYKRQVERTQTISAVKKKALVLFESLNPILSEDTAKAAKQKEIFLKQFEQGNYRIENDRIILVKEDGTDLTDAHGVRVDFDSYVKETASGIYDFKQTAKKDSPGGAAGAGGAGAAGKPVVVKDEADFMKQFQQAKDPKDKVAITEAWEATKKAAGQ